MTARKKEARFNLLIDTCVWLDVAKDYQQQAILAALDELIRQGDIALILPRTVVDEFARNKARVIEDSSRSLSSTLKRAKEAVAKFGDPRKKNTVLNQLNDVDHRLPTLGSAAVDTNGLAWTTVAKIRGLMHRVYKIGILHEHVAKNPVLNVETRSKSSYRAIIITPAQTMTILKSLLSALHYTLVLTCAATALRSSEILALRWSDILWEQGRIWISKRWAKGEDGETKTDASDGEECFGAPLSPCSLSRYWPSRTLRHALAVVPTSSQSGDPQSYGTRLPY